MIPFNAISLTSEPSLTIGTIYRENSVGKFFHDHFEELLRVAAAEKKPLQAPLLCRHSDEFLRVVATTSSILLRRPAESSAVEPDLLSAQKNPCAICLGGIGAGGGQAIFTAECSHTFHFHCISASVAHGHQLCPLCNAHWRELPFGRPADPMPPVDVVQPPQQHRRLPIQPADPVVFDDDEQVGLAAGASADDRRPSGTSYNGAVVIKTHTDYPAVARDSARDNFAVLVHLKAPGTDAAGDAPAPRAPLDLVTVLDVSSSMHGRKLALLKQAMLFVIDILGPDDRLCIVSFSSRARRVTRLARMSDAGKALCARAVESLTARPGTNIAEGLRTAAKVLDERRGRTLRRRGEAFLAVLGHTES
ncbi:hypothetical protein QYE76_044939 [Lolium multiflorum]|uniref:RING-type domain-containing protein n=1 Tax=Lolium multiflorum TaxID=4521 RepID=A0AAD8WZB7_LOLMU|nr:hypothetical protein QYE76_044939 [Lolium multiflorum]